MKKYIISAVIGAVATAAAAVAIILKKHSK